MTAEFRARMLKAFAGQPDGFRSARQAIQHAKGDATAKLAAFRELVESGAVEVREGRYQLAAPAAPAVARKRPAKAAPRSQAPEADPDALPGSTATVAGLAEIYDHEIAETRKTIRQLRTAARNGDPAPGLANLVRTVSELVRRRRELVDDHDAVTLLPDAKLEQEVLEGAREIVAGAIGEADPARIAFAVTESGGGVRVVPLERVLAELGRRHTTRAAG